LDLEIVEYRMKLVKFKSLWRQDGNAKHRMDGGVQLDPEKINCDLTQTEAIFGQEGLESMSVDSTVVQNVLSLFRSIFSNGIYNCPFPPKSSAKSLRYYKKKFMVKKYPKRA
jgi:hypothetical protein